MFATRARTAVTCPHQTSPRTAARAHRGAVTCALSRVPLLQCSPPRPVVARTCHRCTLRKATPNANRVACRRVRDSNQHAMRHLAIDYSSGDDDCRYTECHTCHRPALPRVDATRARLRNHTDCRVATRALFSCLGCMHLRCAECKDQLYQRHAQCHAAESRVAKRSAATSPDRLLS